MYEPIQRATLDVAGEQAWDLISQLYLDITPASRTGTFKAEMAATGSLAVDQVWLDACMEATAELPDQLFAVTILRGRIDVDFGRYGAGRHDAGETVLYPPEVAGHYQFYPTVVRTVRVPMSLVKVGAEALTGLPFQDFRLLAHTPINPTLGQQWAQTAATLAGLLAGFDERGVPPLVHQEVLEVTIAAALTCFPNTAMTRGYVPGPGDVRPVAVRRAVAYIDAEASLPISVRDIAEAAGTTPTALRAAFLKHLDTSVDAYLRRVRLDGAHSDLAAPGSEDTLTSIALRWGYTNRAQFTRDYRTAYGKTPSIGLDNPEAGEDSDIE